MQSEVVAVLGTLGGVLLTGTINYFSNRNGRNHAWRLALARDQVAIRQKLYAEFLVEAQRLVVQAREERVTALRDLNAMNCKFAEVCLVSSVPVIEVAKKLANYSLTSQAVQPADEVANFAFLKDCFIAAARVDMARILSEA